MWWYLVGVCLCLSDLQEADGHEEEAVGADTAGEDFVEVPL